MHCYTIHIGRFLCSIPTENLDVVAYLISIFNKREASKPILLRTQPFFCFSVALSITFMP